MGCFSFVWLRSSEAERNDRTVVNKVPFGTLEPYGDRARRREGFEPHDLRVIASRPSSSRVVLRARQAALPKLALWKTPLAKTPCPWRFGFANPTSHARRSHNPTKEKTARWAVSLLFDVIEQFRCRAKKLLFLVIQGLSGLFVVFQDTFSQESDF